MMKLLYTFLFLCFVVTSHSLSNNTTFNLPSQYSGCSIETVLTHQDDSSNMFLLLTSAQNNYILKFDVESMQIVASTTFPQNLGNYYCGFYLPSSSALVIIAATYPSSIVTLYDSNTLQSSSQCTGIKAPIQGFCQSTSADHGFVLSSNYLFIASFPITPYASSFAKFSLSDCTFDNSLYPISSNETAYSFTYGFVLNESVYAFMFEGNEVGVLAELQLDEDNNMFNVVDSAVIQYFGFVGMKQFPGPQNESLLYLLQNPAPGTVVEFNLNPLTLSSSNTFSVPSSWQIAQGLYVASNAYFIRTSNIMDGYGAFSHMVDTMNGPYAVVGEYVIHISNNNVVQRYDI